MRLQVPLGNELHVALLALERPFSSVRPHMRFQVTCLSKLLKATLEGTNKQLDLCLWAFYFFDFWTV